MKRLGILGLGKMGSSILNGIISSKLYKKEDVLLYMPRKEKQQEYLENGYDVASSEEELFFESKIISTNPHNPGEIVDCNKHLVIGLADGEIEVLELQVEGKKKIKARDFLNGQKIFHIGDIIQ